LALCGLAPARDKTFIAMGEAAPMPTEPFEMVCDRPFMFMLESNGQVLFTGVVNNPADVPTVN
jgi:serine protease inhibitor